MPTVVWPLDKRSNYGGQAIAWGFIDDGPAAAVLPGTPFSSVEWRREVDMVQRVVP